jgi:hypothetical protein
MVPYSIRLVIFSIALLEIGKTEEIMVLILSCIILIDQVRRDSSFGQDKDLRLCSVFGDEYLCSAGLIALGRCLFCSWSFTFL